MDETILQGAFASQSCGARSALTFAVVLGPVALYWLFLSPISYRQVYVAARQRTGPSVEAYCEPKPVLLDNAAKIALAAVGTLIVLFTAAVFALMRSQEVVTLTGTSIIERGCSMGQPYVETFDRDKTTIRYNFSRGRSAYDWLRIEQEGKRAARLALRPQSYHPALIELAPQAMTAFASQLKSEGKPIPNELNDLIPR
jgi:hypothetical protein